MNLEYLPFFFENLVDLTNLKDFEFESSVISWGDKIRAIFDFVS